ncbi:MAG: tetratricopeptide repeat protein [Chloroflexi bacterium]|nr:tetratricopeptide repeat protein [Chloroflexota bacterium]
MTDEPRREAAATVCDVEGSPGQAILEHVESLTAQSLLLCNPDAHGGSRFVMLETIREFASECLVESGEADAIAARHAAWCLDRAEASARDLMGPSQPEVFAGLDADHHDIRAALEWLRAHNEPEMLARLVAAMCWFWALRTRARAWGEECLACCRASGDALSEAQALILLGQVASDAGDDATARPLLEQALQMGRELENAVITGQALYRLGWLAERAHDHAAAHAIHLEGAAVSRISGNLALAIMVLAQAGRSAMEQGDYPAARACLMEGVALNARMRDPLRQALLSASLGELARRGGMPEQARQYLDDALDVLRDAPDRRITALSLDSLARLSLQLGDLEAAQAHAENLLAMRRAFGHADRLVDGLVLLGEVNLRRGNLVPAGAYVAEALSVSARARDPRTLVRCLELAGALASAEQDDARVAQLWGAAEVRRRVLTDTCFLAEGVWTEGAIDASRMRLGATAWAAAVRTGESMPVGQLIACATRA